MKEYTMSHSRDDHESSRSPSPVDHLGEREGSILLRSHSSLSELTVPSTTMSVDGKDDENDVQFGMDGDDRTFREDGDLDVVPVITNDELRETPESSAEPLLHGGHDDTTVTNTITITTTNGTSTVDICDNNKSSREDRDQDNAVDEIEDEDEDDTYVKVPNLNVETPKNDITPSQTQALQGESWAGALERAVSTGNLSHSFTFPSERSVRNFSENLHSSLDKGEVWNGKGIAPRLSPRLHIGEIGRRVTEPLGGSSSPLLSASPQPPGTPTLQERRLYLRKLRMDATPVISSISPSILPNNDHDNDNEMSPTGNFFGQKPHHKTRGHFRRSSTLPRTFQETPSRVSLFQNENVTPPSNSRKVSGTGSILNLENAPLSPIQASILQHHRSNSVENSRYIEHLEREVADLNAKLKSYTDSSSDQSHASVMQRLNSKVRNLQNQVTEWETVFEDRVREMERIRTMEKNTSNTQMRSLRDQVDTLRRMNNELEEQLDFERKRASVAIGEDASDKQAIVQHNEQLIMELNLAHERMNSMEKTYEEYRSRGGSVSTIRLVPKEKPEDNIEDINNTDEPRTTTPVLPDSPESTTSNSATSAGIRTRKMRRFPSGISAPKQLILPSSVEESPSTRNSSMDYTHSRRSSGMWSFSREMNLGERDSLFAELSKAGIPETPSQVTDDESASVISAVPLSSSRRSSRRFSLPASRPGSRPVSRPVSRPMSFSSTRPVTSRRNSRAEVIENAPPSPTDTETSAEESLPSRSPSPPTGEMSSNLFPILFAPLKLTGSVISTIGKSVYDPRWAVREVRNRAMESMSDTESSEEYHDPDIAFGGSPDCTPKGMNGSDKENQTPGTAGRREMDEQSPLSRRYYQPSPPEVRSEQDMHIDNTLQKLCSPDATPVLGDHRSSSSSRREEEPTPTKHPRQSRVETKNGMKKGILPIRTHYASSQSQSEEKSKGGKRFSSPPPYTHTDPFFGDARNMNYASAAAAINYAAAAAAASRSHAQELALRYTNSFCSSSETDDGSGGGLIIPESELARVLRQDIQNGSLLKVLGLDAESPVVLWTKLFFTFLVAIFVGVRDGPEAALESIHFYKNEGVVNRVKRYEDIEVEE